MTAAKKAAGKQAVTLHDHIKELRNRLFVVAIVFVVVSAVAYNYKDTLVYYLLKPLGDQKLIYLNPAGGFSFIFQVTMYVGIAAAVPFLVYNLYKFVAPALPERARKHSALVMISSLFLLLCGVAFGYLFAIPGALNFLDHFAEGYITPNLTADSYLNFLLAYTAGLGILFQLPLVLLLLHWIHPLKPKGLFKFERYMILMSFVAAAMITPTPDALNQTVMALPIIVMYQIGVIAVCISVFKEKRRNRPPKLSRAERKAQKKAVKAAPRGGGLQKPIPVSPAMPSVTDLVATIATPQPVAVKAQAPRPRRTIDVTSVPQAAVKPMAPSQTRKSMDIMLAPQNMSFTGRGAITRPERPVHHRTPALQVPQRTIPSRSAPLVDGISLVS